VTLEVVTFWGLAVLLIGSALSVVLTKNLFHSVLWLALSLTATAGIFLALEAEFLAAVQLLLYAGGVVTIVVFAIVVTERLVGERITQTSRHIVTGVVLAGALLLAVLRFLRGADLPIERPVIAVDVTRALGQVLMTEFVLPFELLAVLLLVGLLGADRTQQRVALGEHAGEVRQVLSGAARSLGEDRVEEPATLRRRPHQQQHLLRAEQHRPHDLRQ